MGLLGQVCLLGWVIGPINLTLTTLVTDRPPQYPLKILLFDSLGEKIDFDVISPYPVMFGGMLLTLQYPDSGSIKFWRCPCLPRSMVRSKSNGRGPISFREWEFYRSQFLHDYKGVLKSILFLTFGDHTVPELIHWTCPSPFSSFPWRLQTITSCPRSLFQTCKSTQNLYHFYSKLVTFFC